MSNANLDIKLIFANKISNMLIKYRQKMRKTGHFILSEDAGEAVSSFQWPRKFDTSFSLI